MRCPRQADLPDHASGSSAFERVEDRRGAAPSTCSCSASGFSDRKRRCVEPKTRRAGRGERRKARDVDMDEGVARHLAASPSGRRRPMRARPVLVVELVEVGLRVRRTRTPGRRSRARPGRHFLGEERRTSPCPPAGSTRRTSSPESTPRGRSSSPTHHVLVEVDALAASSCTTQSRALFPSGNW